MSLPLPEPANASNAESKIEEELKDIFVEDTITQTGASISKDENQNPPPTAQVPIDRSSSFSIEALRLGFLAFLKGFSHPKQKLKSKYDNSFLRWLDDYFTLSTLNTSIGIEIIGGFTSYFVAAYILLRNPAILTTTGMNESALYIATAIIAGLGTFFVGFLGKVPIVIAPGMGMNAFIAFTVVAKNGVEWENALGMTLIAGILYFIVVLFGLRQKVILSLPEYYRIGLSVGVALFLAIIGANGMKLIKGDAATLVTLGTLNWRMGVGLLCLLLTACLILRNIKPAFIIAIISTSILIVIIEAIFFRDLLTFDVNEFTQYPISPVAGRLRFNFSLKALYMIPCIFLLHIFDSVSVVLLILRQAYLSNAKVDLKMEDIENSLAGSKKVRLILLIDAFFFMLSPIIGTTASTPFVESATGVAVGAKSGLSSVVAGFLFLISIFLKPIVKYIAAEATGAALIVTAILLIPFLRHLRFHHYEELMPALFTMIMIPFSYSIVNGAAFGYAFILTWVFIGKWRKITPVMWILIVLSLLQILSNLFTQ